jgi:lipoprotein-anchoring transpeptidase ErfK/SrfK
MCRTPIVAYLMLTASAIPGSEAAELSSDSINSASFSGWSQTAPAGKPDPFLIRLQVLLDRSHVSPGVIDGFLGDNLKKAVRVYEEREGLESDGEIDEKLWAMLRSDAAPALQIYRITGDDVSGRYVEEIPEDYAQMAEMDWLGYRGPKEMLAERFHMDEDLLETLNPAADFSAVGTEILVANPGDNAHGRVARIVVDRSSGELLAYAEEDKLIVAYPATIGSTESPSPSGTHNVTAAITDPTYTYRPDQNFQQGDNEQPLELPPGPNGPVGSIWIDISEPTYGIHGTSDPALIDKEQSHGCVRLTNWDAQELAKLVEQGTPAEFQE